MSQTENLEAVFRPHMFRIPSYQRGFAWEPRHVEALLDDLDLMRSDGRHFLGTLVVKDAGDGVFTDEEGNTYRTYDVIDGQQRLTTLVILLDAIHDEFERLGDAFATGLRKTYLSLRDRDGQPHTKLTVNEDCQGYFYGDVLGFAPSLEGPTTRAHHNLSEARQRCQAYLAQAQTREGDRYPIWLDNLRRKVTQGLQVIFYPVERDAEAGVIFETMNDRGKALTDLEKIKNYFLYLASKLELAEDHGLDRKVAKIWQDIYEMLMASGLGDDANEDQLLRTHWLAAYDPLPRNWHGYSSVKERFALKGYRDQHPLLLADLMRYLDSLHDTARAYCDIETPRRGGAFSEIVDAELRTAVLAYSEKLVRLGTRAAFLPLLCAVRLKSADAGATYLQVLRLCELYDFRVYEWLRRRAQTGQSTLSGLANRFYRGLPPDQLMSSLTELILRYCPGDRFLERFSLETEDWYHWSGLKYFLYEYELHLAHQVREPVHMHWEDITDTKRDTIEHILPQSPTSEWGRAFPDEAQRKRWTHDIGNLTLTYDNSSLGVKPFAEKKGEPGLPSCYASSSFFVERQVATYPRWTGHEIRERRERIRAWAVERWQVDETAILRDQEPEISVEAVRSLAEDGGVEDVFDSIYAFATSHGLVSRPYKASVGLATPRNHNRPLLTVWPRDGYLHVGVWFGNFQRMLQIPERDLQVAFETPEERFWTKLTPRDTDDFCTRLDRVLPGTIGANQADSQDAGDAKEASAGTSVILQEFWMQLLAAAQHRTTLHTEATPSTRGWVSTNAGRRGLWYSYAIRRHSGQIELYIDRGRDSEGESKRIFDTLAEHRSDIEAAFGDSLEWQRLDNRRACRIGKRIALGGYRDHGKWPEIQDEMIGAMVRLEQALRPHIARLPK